MTNDIDENPTPATAGNFAYPKGTILKVRVKRRLYEADEVAYIVGDTYEDGRTLLTRLSGGGYHLTRCRTMEELSVRHSVIYTTLQVIKKVGA